MASAKIENLDKSTLSTKTTKSLTCNHCCYEFQNYADMKEHYKSQYHLYNLHRVTAQLNPVSYEEYLKRKEALEKKKTPNISVKSQGKDSTQYTSNYCDICSKSFASSNKMTEHIASKTHKLRKQSFDERVKKQKERSLSKNKDENNRSETPKKKTATAKDNHLVCFVCNNDESTSITDTINHLKLAHNFEFPVSYCMKSFDKAIKLIITKIFKYGACLYCDSQKFPNPKAIQCHMRDTNHVRINFEDIIEHFYKFYDKTKLAAVTGVDRKLKEFQLLKRMLLPKKGAKNKEEKIVEEVDGEEWEEVDDEDEEEVNTKKEKKDDDSNSLDEDINDINYIRMENGEIMLRDGTVLGNKIYKNYYKQRVKVTSVAETQERRIMKIRAAMMRRKELKLRNKTKSYSQHYKLSGSTKSLFTRVNTLFKARKQVNV